MDSPQTLRSTREGSEALSLVTLPGDWWPRPCSHNWGPVEASTSPFQHAMTTRAGCECVAHTLQALTESDPEATIVPSTASVRQFKDAALPLERMFHGRPSTCPWSPQTAMSTTSHKARVRQGDPLMALLFSLGQHPVLIAPQARLEVTEKMFAYLDDIHLVCHTE